MNQEQIEALQVDIDEDRNYRKQFLKKKSRADIEFVEKELVKFQKRGIPVYIYAYLSTVNDDAKEYKSVYQYNNLGCFREEDENGKPTPEFLLLLHKVNKQLSYHIVRLLGHIDTMPDTLEQCLEMAQNGARNVYACFCWCVGKDPHETELLERIKKKNEND